MSIVLIIIIGKPIIIIVSKIIIIIVSYHIETQNIIYIFIKVKLNNKRVLYLVLI